MADSSDITLYIDPFSYHFLEDRLFDRALETYQAQNILEPWIYLRDWFQARGAQVFTADRLTNDTRHSRLNVYVSLGLRDKCRELAARGDVVMSAYFAFEGPIVEPALYRDLAWVSECVRRVYSFSDADALAPFLTNGRRPEFLHFCVPSPAESVDDDVWSNPERGSLVMINGNRLPRLFVDELYTERLRALEFFGTRDEIDLYGLGWNDPPYRPYDSWVPATIQHAHRKLIAWKHRVKPDPLLEAARGVYRGSTETKIRTLGGYRFAICFENQILKGWITEKIFDCFRAGTVPVYLGAPDIEDWVPTDCFIDMRRFAGYPELREFVSALGQDEIDDYRQAARDFLTSDRFYPFSKEAFVDRLVTIVEEDTGVLVG
jgi:hypothetical protein